MCLSQAHQVSTALNGELGLSACQEHGFDVVVTDIFMPFRDGLDILREVSKRYPHIKVIAMSGRFGSGRTDYLKAAEVMGAVAQLRKPFTQDELLTVVNQALDL